MEAPPENGGTGSAGNTETSRPNRREQRITMPEEMRYDEQLQLPHLIDWYWYTVELKVLITTAEDLKMGRENANEELEIDIAMKLAKQHSESSKILETIMKEIKSRAEKNGGDLEDLADHADEESIERFYSAASTVTASSGSNVKGEVDHGTIEVGEKSRVNQTLSSRSKVQEWLNLSDYDGHKNSDAAAAAPTTEDDTNINGGKLRMDSVHVVIKTLPTKILERLGKIKVQGVSKKAASQGDSGNTGSSPLMPMETGRKGRNHDDRGSQQDKIPTSVKPAFVVMRRSARKRTPARPLSRTIRCIPSKKNRPRTVLIETQEEAETGGDDYVDPSSGVTSSGPMGTKIKSSPQPSAGQGENRAPLPLDNNSNGQSSSHSSSK